MEEYNGRTKIVIIDSGIRSDHAMIDEKVEGIHFTFSQEDVYVDKDINDDLGHGTAIYGIIK